MLEQPTQEQQGKKRTRVLIILLVLIMITGVIGVGIHVMRVLMSEQATIMSTGKVRYPEWKGGIVDAEDPYEVLKRERRFEPNVETGPQVRIQKDQEKSENTEEAVVRTVE